MKFSNIDVKGNFLVDENPLLITKINVQSIDEILIFHYTPSGSHRFYMFLNQPIQYELKHHNVLNKILFSIFKTFNTNSFAIKKVYQDDELKPILKIIDDSLNGALLPIDLDQSFAWQTVDEGINFKKVKLIYSKNGLGLNEVMRKYKILADQ